MGVPVHVAIDINTDIGQLMVLYNTIQEKEGGGGIAHGSSARMRSSRELPGAHRAILISSHSVSKVDISMPRAATALQAKSDYFSIAAINCPTLV